MKGNGRGNGKEVMAIRLQKPQTVENAFRGAFAELSRKLGTNSKKQIPLIMIVLLIIVSGRKPSKQEKLVIIIVSGKQASKQASKQTSKQAGKQASKQAAQLPRSFRKAFATCTGASFERIPVRGVL